jgi:hypothetical protein
VARRHLDVGDHDIRLVGERLAKKVIRVRSHTDHVEAGVLEDVHHPSPNDRLILAHDDANRGGIARHAHLLTAPD